MTDAELLHTVKVHRNEIGHYTGFAFVHALEKRLAAPAVPTEAVLLRQLAEAIADGEGDPQEMAQQTLAEIAALAPGARP